MFLLLTRLLTRFLIIVLFFSQIMIDKQVNGEERISLNTTNLLTIKGQINEKLASRFVYEVNKNGKKNGLYVFIDTNGGDVDAGNQIVDEIQKHNLTCIAKNAISMGFVIMQSCHERYITKYGIMMQHQMSYGVMDEKAKVESYVNFISQIGETLTRMQANKIGIDVDEFTKKTYNDWWLFGDNAIEEGVADKVVDVSCTSALTNIKYTEEKGGYIYTYSKCPLISQYIEKEKKNKTSSSSLLDDYLVFV